MRETEKYNGATCIMLYLFKAQFFGITNAVVSITDWVSFAHLGIYFLTLCIVVVT